MGHATVNSFESLVGWATVIMLNKLVVLDVLKLIW